MTRNNSDPPDFDLDELGLEVTNREISCLKPNPRNARTHSKKQLRQIARSIGYFGFTNPVLIDADNMIIAGHGRVEAARLLGMAQVPTIQLNHLSGEQLRAYIIADNKLAENAGWDRETLAIELQYLTELEIDFDVEIMGFEAVEIDMLLESIDQEDDEDDADVIPEVSDRHLPVSRLGDLWILGPHRLLCGDARDAGAYKDLMGQFKARLVFTDPPYNVPIDGHVCGSGQIKHGEFAMASGEMSDTEFADFLRESMSNFAIYSVDGSFHFICMDWRHMHVLLLAGLAVYDEFKNLIVWRKTNAGMGSFYRSQHELIFVFKNGRAPHVNNIELGKHGRNRSNVWTYAGVNTFKPNRMEELSLHPTVKPVKMVVDAIKDCSRRNEIVLDAFAGSGTTIIAAHKARRRAFAMEIDPKYVDVAIKRLQNLTRIQAIHAGSGLSFDEMSARRANERSKSKLN